ncbi:MAG: oxygen-dependent coproporphyrinogen oxidase [Prolixibacteraceae bacterium]
MRKDLVSNVYRDLQQQICSQLEKADGKGGFKDDSWKSEIGYGHTMVLQQGDAMEKGAVNFSAVSGQVNASMRRALQIEEGQGYFASGISSIIHPFNPFAPIIHMNVRYFELSSGACWFGGGIDLTPHYIDKREVAWFHGELKSICDRFDPAYYPNFKEQADHYFYLPHRQETRGAGGIFFDHQFAGETAAFEKLFNFTRSLAEAYPLIYISLLEKNRNRRYTPAERDWQYLRRGRYVEFNLLYDRGTKFGLESGGRTESIFLSMPPMACWAYDFQPEEGSPEANTLSMLKKGIDWGETVVSR